MVSGLSSANCIQPDLFEYNPERSKRLRSLSEVLDRVNGKMGADTLMLGAQQYIDKGEDGKSIKFVNAIKRAMKSPEYSTSLDAFKVG